MVSPKGYNFDIIHMAVVDVHNALECNMPCSLYALCLVQDMADPLGLLGHVHALVQPIEIRHHEFA